MTPSAKNQAAILANTSKPVLCGWAVVCISVFLFHCPISADTLHNGDPAIRDNKTDRTHPPPSKFSLAVNGFIEFEDFISPHPRQEFSEINKKSELRGNLRIRYGGDSFYLFSITNMYIAPVFIDEHINDEYIYSDDFKVGPNGRISNRAFEIDFRELYLNLGFNKFRMRAGNQIYGWGSADVFNPTSYFNPFDLREFLFRDDDELKKGIPSLSTLLFLDIFTVELVFTPIHTQMDMADRDNFWALKYREGPFPVYVAQSDHNPFSVEDSSFGARFSKSATGMDFSFSFFHGPDRDAVFRPYRTVLSVNNPVSVEVIPEHVPVTTLGFDFSTDLGKFVLQGEVAYSPDKAGIVDQAYSVNTRFPFEVKRSHFISYSAGFNYFIPLNRLIENHEGETIFTMEWFQSRYFDGTLMDPLITDILTARFQDSYFDSRISIMITAMADVVNLGYLLWPKIEYDFLNGLKVSLSYGHIEGSDNSIFGYFNDNDIIMLKVRYVFQ